MEIMRLNIRAENLIGKFLAVWYAWNIFLRCNGGGGLCWKRSLRHIIQDV